MEDLEEMSHKILPNLYRALEDFEAVLRVYVERLYRRYVVEKLREDLGGFARIYESIRRSEIERAVARLHLGERERVAGSSHRLYNEEGHRCFRKHARG
jgi:glutamyl-tRNA reductase